MKSTLKSFILGMALLVPAYGLQTTMTYTNNALHYQLTIPLQWLPMSEETMQQARQTVYSAVKSLNRPNMVDGFVYSDEGDSAISYFIISHSDAKGRTLSDFASEVRRGEVTLKARDMTAQNDIYRNIHLSDPIVDNKSHRVIFTARQQRPNEEAWIVHSVMAFGRKGCVLIGFYVPEILYPQRKADIDAIINSLQFQPGFEYSPFRANLENLSKAIKDSPEIIILLGFGIIAFMLWRKRSGRSSEPGTPEASSEKRNT